MPETQEFDNIHFELKTDFIPKIGIEESISIKQGDKELGQIKNLNRGEGRRVIKKLESD